MLEILGKTSIDFMGLRRYSFALSGVLVFVGLIALVQIWRGAANLGIDFAGGTAVQLKFDQPIPIEQARQALVRHGFGEVEIQDITPGNKLLIRVKAQTAIEEGVAEKVLGTFKKDFASIAFVVDSSYEIGPTIGQELLKDALFTISISKLSIIVSVVILFRCSWGSSSVPIHRCSSPAPCSSSGKGLRESCSADPKGVAIIPLTKYKLGAIMSLESEGRDHDEAAKEHLRDRLQVQHRGA